MDHMNDASKTAIVVILALDDAFDFNLTLSLDGDRGGWDWSL